MSYQLESMLRIRLMREDRASKDLVSARHAQEVAAAALEKSETRYREWSETKEDRRDRIYDAIMGVPVKRLEIELAKEAVSRIDEEGALLNDGVTRSKADLKAKEEESAKARGRYVAALRNREKIVRHREVWAEEERKRQEYSAEAELEEFTGRKMHDDESDDFD